MTQGPSRETVTLAVRDQSGIMRPRPPEHRPTTLIGGTMRISSAWQAMCGSHGLVADDGRIALGGHSQAWRLHSEEMPIGEAR